MKADAPARAGRRRRTERARPSAFWILALVILPVISTVTRLRIVDGHKLPPHGACIIVPNHVSELDPVIVGVGVWRLGRLPRFLAKGSLFRVPIVGWLLRRSGQIPVERAAVSRQGSPLDAARLVAERGNAVIVYPEGTLTRDPDLWPMRGKTGAARMALRYGLPVIPVAHWGVQDVLGRYSHRVRLFPPRRIRIVFGDPVDLEAFRGRPIDATTLAEATEAIMVAITGLVARLRGTTPPTGRWDPAAHDQKETGRFEA
ncbi:MAG TPA: lysophospholipid acyltransferase family protein [Microbacteriaceae bacterium]|nr:lysophospholipid acyltransferase family protein [Microbacteriaceae bacterium]